MKVRELAALLEGEAAGELDREIDSGAALEAAGPADLAFVESPRTWAAVGAIQAGCLLIPPEVKDFGDRTVIQVQRPREAFARALRQLRPAERPAAGVHRTASIDPSVSLGDGVSIGPYVVLEKGARIGAKTVIGAYVFVGAGSTIGADSTLGPGVRIYPNVRIGDRATLHAGGVIGADGFGFVFEGDHYEKFPQIGGVVIGDDFELGANACVDRGALGDTVIGRGVKLDNLVHIGHNCRLGDHVVIAAQTGLSGGVVVEDYVVMGGQVGISEKAVIKTRAILGAQAGILPHKTLESGQTFWGTPARIHREHLKKLALVDRLPKLMAEIEELRRRLQERERS